MHRVNFDIPAEEHGLEQEISQGKEGNVLFIDSLNTFLFTVI